MHTAVMGMSVTASPVRQPLPLWLQIPPPLPRRRQNTLPPLSFRSQQPLPRPEQSMRPRHLSFQSIPPVLRLEQSILTFSSAASKPITASSAYSSIASPTPQIVLPGNGTTVLYNNTIVDGTQSPQARWNAGGGPDVLTAVLNAWLRQRVSRNLNFPEFVSHYFAGPDNWNCQDIGNIPRARWWPPAQM